MLINERAIKMLDKFLNELEQSAKQSGMNERDIQSLINRYKGDFSLRCDFRSAGILPFNRNYKI